MCKEIILRQQNAVGAGLLRLRGKKQTFEIDLEEWGEGRTGKEDGLLMTQTEKEGAQGSVWVGQREVCGSS